MSKSNTKESKSNAKDKGKEKDAKAAVPSRSKPSCDDLCWQYFTLLQALGLEINSISDKTSPELVEVYINTAGKLPPDAFRSHKSLIDEAIALGHVSDDELAKFWRHKRVKPIQFREPTAPPQAAAATKPRPQTAPQWPMAVSGKIQEIPLQERAALPRFLQDWVYDEKSGIPILTQSVSEICRHLPSPLTPEFVRKARPAIVLTIWEGAVATLKEICTMPTVGFVAEALEALQTRKGTEKELKGDAAEFSNLFSIGRKFAVAVCIQLS